MAENKTKPTRKNVASYLAEIEDLVRQADCKTIAAMIEELTGSKPRMWGEAIVGFGDYRYKYASGREGDWFLAGFSNRKQSISLYIMGYLEYYTEILEDLDVLRTLISTSIERLKNHH